MKIVLTLDLTVHGNISDAEALDFVMENNGLPGAFMPPGYDSDDDPGWLIEVESVTGEIAPDCARQSALGITPEVK